MESDNRQESIQPLTQFKREVSNEDAYATIEITSIRPARNLYQKAQQRRYLRLALAIIAVSMLLTTATLSIIVYLQNRSTTINVGSPLWTFNTPDMPEDMLHWNENSTQLSFPTKNLTQTQMYNLSTRKLIQYPDINHSLSYQTNQSQAIELSPDSKYLITIVYNSANHLKEHLFIWDIMTGKLRFRYTYHGKPATGEEIASTTKWWSTDNAQMATLDNDGSLIIWQALSGKPPFRLNDIHTPFDYVTWSTNGKELAASTESGHVEIWDLTKKARLSVGLVSPTISSLTFSPNTQYLAAIDNDSLYVLSADTDTITVDNSLSLPIIDSAPVIWSANSQYMIVTGKDADSISNNAYSTAVWEADASRQIMTTQILQQNDKTVSVSPDKNYMATIEGDRNTVDVWDINTGHKVSTHLGGINTSNPLLAWSPDGKYLAATFKNNEMRIWNAQTGTDMMIFNKLSGIQSGSSASIQTIQWSPDNSYIAITNTYTGKDARTQYMVEIWNTPLN